ncbi:hypothetical protein OWM07_11095 [Deferribacter thermophilus]
MQKITKHLKNINLILPKKYYVKGKKLYIYDYIKIFGIYDIVIIDYL